MSSLFGSMRKSRSASSSNTSLPSPARLSEGCGAELDIHFMKQLAKEAKFHPVKAQGLVLRVKEGGGIRRCHNQVTCDMQRYRDVHMTLNRVFWSIFPPVTLKKKTRVNVDL
ncbi:hypothetical protein TNIN_139821 [Trichonephila inaurata madagascariensis]|uniref:Uncharacterized protein n=1 Tax=Trichonephila inaurata madagascariensis TaxID=2747483 RepID=A0A8X6WRC9_9ARAC|nr:hypothetical protein TNIN_139821 [Trichonephila inaurata madagascariensis]